MRNGQLNKALNLLERIDSNYRLLVEAQGQPRRQVSRDEILDVLEKNDETGRGKFASFTYIKYKSLYKGSRGWRREDVATALDNNRETRGGEDWFKSLEDFNNQEKIKGNNPLLGVIAVTRYVINWASKDSYNKDYSDYEEKLTNLRQKNGIARPSAGKLDTNKNIRQTFDYGGGAHQANQTGFMSRDFNMAKVQRRVDSQAYFVDSEGHIVTDLPRDIVKSMSAPYKPKGVEVYVKQQLADNQAALQAYAEAKAELDAAFDGHNYLLDQVLCIVVTVGGEQLYYINDRAIALLPKEKDKPREPMKLNQSELVKLAEEQIGETFDVLDSSEFAN